MRGMWSDDVEIKWQEIGVEWGEGHDVIGVAYFY